jgi:YesN/AraC family two-component response regulator
MIYEPLFKLERTGVQIQYYTSRRRRYNPMHWHSAVELIYILNGNGTIMIEGKDYPVVAGEFLVVDSNQMHETKCARASMMVMIHFSRNSMKNFIPELEQYHFHCTKETLKKEQLDGYLAICDMLKKLPPLYVMQPVGYKLKSQAVAMEVFFELLNHFSSRESQVQATGKTEILERLGEITEYIELHHREPISLESISSHFYLSREYFSRFFKQNMGVTFSKYVSQVRLMHIYQDICNTSDGILELAEGHGFTNYKLFNKMFHETYGCAPRDVRRKIKEEE